MIRNARRQRLGRGATTERLVSAPCSAPGDVLGVHTMTNPAQLASSADPITREIGNTDNLFETEIGHPLPEPIVLSGASPGAGDYGTCDASGFEGLPRSQANFNTVPSTWDYMTETSMRSTIYHDVMGTGIMSTFGHPQQRGWALNHGNAPGMDYARPANPVFKCEWNGCCYTGTFRRTADLIRHLKSTHIEPNAFICPSIGCNHMFNRKDNLKTHVRRMHPWMVGWT